jgi:hypothetical protein
MKGVTFFRYINLYTVSFKAGHAVRHYATSRKAAGSRTDEVKDFFFNLPNPSGRNRPWWVTHPLTEMSTRCREIMFLGSRAWLLREADNLTSICEPIV